jgi:hypothetical protein
MRTISHHLTKYEKSIEKRIAKAQRGNLLHLCIYLALQNAFTFEDDELRNLKRKTQLKESILSYSSLLFPK